MADETDNTNEHEPSAEEENGTERASSLGFQSERIDDLLIEEEMKDAYLTYAMSTIMDRALPDVRDGLKPSQRASWWP